MRKEHKWKKELQEEKQSDSSAWIAAVEIMQRCADVLPATALCGGIAWGVKRRAKRQLMGLIWTRTIKGYTFIALDRKI